MFTRCRSLSSGRKKGKQIDEDILTGRTGAKQSEENKTDETEKMENPTENLPKDPHSLNLKIAIEELRREFSNDLRTKINQVYVGLNEELENTVKKPNKFPYKIKPSPCIVDDNVCQTSYADDFPKLEKMFSRLPEFQGGNPRGYLLQFNNICDSNHRNGRTLSASDAKNALLSKLAPDIFIQYPDIAEMSFFDLFDSLITRYDSSEVPTDALDKLFKISNYVRNYDDLLKESLRLYGLIPLEKTDKYRFFLFAMRSCVPNHLKEKLDYLSKGPANIERVLNEMKPYAREITKILEKSRKFRSVEVSDSEQNSHKPDSDSRLGRHFPRNRRPFYRRNSWNKENIDPSQRNVICERCSLHGHSKQNCRVRMCNLCSSKFHTTVECTMYPNIEPIVGECSKCREKINKQLRHRTSECVGFTPEKN